MPSPAARNHTHVSVDTFLCEDAARRAAFLCWALALGFSLFGLTFYEVLAHFEPQITLAMNVWPRVLFNGVPFFALGFFLLRRSVRAATRLWVFTIAHPAIVVAACCIHVWPLIYAGRTGLYIHAHGANLMVVCFAILWVSPPTRFLYGLVGALAIVFIAPLLYLIWRTEGPALARFIAFDFVYALGVGAIGSEAIHRLRHALALSYRTTADELEDTRARALLAGFATKIAHDLKSPLAAAQTILDHPRNHTIYERDFLTTCLQRIAALADDLLHRHVDTNLSVPSERLRETLNNLQKEKQIEYAAHPNLKIIWHQNLTHLPPRIPLHLPTLQRALSNTVNNAIRATNYTGTVKITAAIDTDHLLFIIQDHGHGIPAAHLQAIRDRRLHDHLATGHGLGLETLFTFIDSHRGTAAFDSEVGKGTTLTLRVPFQFAATPS